MKTKQEEEISSKKYNQELEKAKQELAAELQRSYDNSDLHYAELAKRHPDFNELFRYDRCKSDVIRRLALLLFDLEIIPYQQKNKICARLVSDLKGSVLSTKEVRESVPKDWKA